MKNIIAQYGWIVLVTLIMAIMVAFATPFGRYLGNAFVASMNNSKDTLDHVIDEGVNSRNEEMEKLFISNEYKESGLYTINNNSEVLSLTWTDLRKSNAILTEEVNGYKITFTQYDAITQLNASSGLLDGHLVINSDILVLPNNAFANCDELDCVTLKNVDVVQSNAFKDCDKLTTIIINRTEMEGFEEGAIVNCPNFNTIIFNGTFLQFKEINFAKQYLPQQITVVCTDRAVTMNFE